MYACIILPCSVTPIPWRRSLFWQTLPLHLAQSSKALPRKHPTARHWSTRLFVILEGSRRTNRFEIKTKTCSLINLPNVARPATFSLTWATTVGRGYFDPSVEPKFGKIQTFQIHIKLTGRVLGHVGRNPKKKLINAQRLTVGSLASTPPPPPPSLHPDRPTTGVWLIEQIICFVLCGGGGGFFGVTVRRTLRIWHSEPPAMAGLFTQSAEAKQTAALP